MIQPFGVDNISTPPRLATLHPARAQRSRDYFCPMNDIIRSSRLAAILLLSSNLVTKRLKRMPKITKFQLGRSRPFWINLKCIVTIPRPRGTHQPDRSQQKLAVRSWVVDDPTNFPRGRQPASSGPNRLNWTWIWAGHNYTVSKKNANHFLFTIYFTNVHVGLSS